MQVDHILTPKNTIESDEILSCPKCMGAEFHITYEFQVFCGGCLTEIVFQGEDNDTSN